jgi:hypothetical protein
MNFYMFLRELLFRLKLYYLGIRFYEATPLMTHPVIHQTSYLFDDVTVHVSFKRIPCRDLVLKRGKLSSEEYHSYAVIAAFDREELNRLENREALARLEFIQNKAFFFNGHYNKLGLGEKRRLELITDVYMDFLSATFKQVKT